MITTETYQIDWIQSVKKALGKRQDPKLIEKVIYALLLLEQLKINKLDFVFKGGTALLLYSENPQRFSIDIDIITEKSSDEIQTILGKITEQSIFINWENDSERGHLQNALIGHFKLYYTSQVDGKTEPILLDVLYAENPYPVLKEIPIQHKWLQTKDPIYQVSVPSFDAILGDKLTAFAPNTTGILYSKNRPVEIIKQLFDISYLMDFIEDIDVVRNSYNKVVNEEIKFRNLSISANDVLNDTFETCFMLAMRDVKSKDFQHLQLGIKNFVNFTLVNFHLEQAIVASAKVAYLTEILKAEKPHTIMPFSNPNQIKDWWIENPRYNKLNKLKKNNPKAFYYWYQTLLMKEC